MQKQTFARLAEEAAAGLRADRELFLDVKQELENHLADKAEYYVRQGHSSEESAELSCKSFGSPLDVAAELLKANRKKMKLRATLRLAFSALIVPLAIIFALYVGYGRMAREQVALARLNDMVTTSPNAKLPTLPFFDLPDDSTTQTSIVTQLAGRPENAENIRRYWKNHRNAPNSYMYYAYYARLLQPRDENSYVEAMRLGEQIEPGNALYNLLLAEFYLEQGMSAKSEKVNRKDEVRTDDLLDRRTFELGIVELRTAARKRYYRSYEREITREKLNALPHPLLTEDYLRQVGIAASELFPELKSQRALARKIPGCARILVAEGRRADAQSLMDTWKPLTELIIRDSTSLLIKSLTAHACATTLSREGADVYASLGEDSTANETRAIGERLVRLDKERRSRKSNTVSQDRDRLVRLHGSREASFLYPVFSGVDPGIVTEQELRPERMAEHILFEEIAVQILLLLLLLSLLGALFHGANWLHKIRGAKAIPLLLLPKASEMLHILCVGLLLPMIVYWCYSRMPVLGGREYGWASSMLPRFVTEIVLLATIILVLPVYLLRKNIRHRCDELGIDMPDPRIERQTNLLVRGGLIVVFALIGIGLFLPLEISPYLRIIAVSSAIGIGIMGMIYTRKARAQYGLYHGTLARSLAPVYAFSIILLATVAQPWLLYHEAYWLRHDTLNFANYANSTSNTAGCTLIETRASEHISRQLLEILEIKHAK